MTRRLVGMFAITMLAMGPSLLTAGGSPETRLRATLTGPRIGLLTPSGQADYRARDGRARLTIQVEDVSVAVGTVLDAYINGTKAGTITVGAVTLGGELDLNTDDGQSVPSVAKGAVVVVKLGDQAVLAGVF